MRLTLFAILALVILFPWPVVAEVGTWPDCEEFEPRAETDIAAIGHVQIDRGPFDFEGARIVGCIENRSEEPLQDPALVYDNIQERGGGGGTTSISTGDLAPGEVGRFQTRPFRTDEERIQSRGIEGIEIRGIQVQEGRERDTYRLSARIEMEYPLLPLPDSELSAACEQLESESHTGEVALSELHVVTLPDGETRVAGCIVNGLDDSLADNMRNRLNANYQGYPSQEYDGVREWSGSGSLSLPGLLEPDNTSLFITEFDIPDGISRIEVTPMRRVSQNGFYRTEPAGEPAIIEQ